MMQNLKEKRKKLESILKKGCVLLKSPVEQFIPFFLALLKGKKKKQETLMLCN